MMELTVFLMMTLGLIGSIDGFNFHILKYRLYRQPSARWENVTHWIRATTFVFSLGLLLYYRPEGGWYWAMVAVFSLDFVDNVVDVIIEPHSRKPLGGISGPEYLVHMIVMAFSGGIWVSFLAAGWAGRNATTALVPHAAGFLPVWAMWAGRLMVVGGVALLLLEIGLSVGAARSAKSQPASR